MKTALILGITGGFGSAMASVLKARSWRIKALVRSPEKVSEALQDSELIKGDAGDADSVSRAAEGVDAIIYALNVSYQRWHEEARPLLEKAVTVAEKNQLLIVFPANVYVLDPALGPEFDETAKIQPISKKGKIRAQMERRLLRASQNGAQVLMVRAGDFIGKEADNGWLAQLLIKRGDSYILLDPTPADHVHSWAYLGDLALATVELMEHSSSLTAFEVFHFRGYQLTMAELKAAIEDHTGAAVKMKPFPWWLVKIMAAFAKGPREILELRYLWEQDLRLDQQKLEKVLNKVPRQTPPHEALLESLLL